MFLIISNNFFRQLKKSKQADKQKHEVRVSASVVLNFWALARSRAIVNFVKMKEWREARLHIWHGALAHMSNT